MAAPASEELFPMRTVASLTGVNPVTLRAWERRYGLVSPRRAPGGHRLYTRADVDLLRRVVGLLDAGMSIGRVVKLVRAGDGAPPAPAPGYAAPHSDFVARLLAAVEALDEAAADAAYGEALALYPVETVNEKILAPVLRELGARWSRRRGGIAEEHFFTTFVRNKLGAAMHHLSRGARGPRLLAACMPDERHDLGLLMFATAAARRGYRVVTLGAAVPLGELEPAARSCAPDALLLSMTMKPSRGVLETGLRELARALEVPLLIGGAQAGPNRAALEAAGARVLGDDPAPALDWLDTHLAT